MVVTGSTGFLGSALVRSLERGGTQVVRLLRPGSTRHAPRAGSARWDPATGCIDAAALEGADAVVHLAGASVGARPWTRSYKDVILRSRVDSTRLLAHTLANLQEPPPVLVSASAIGWYGDRGDKILTEESPPGHGFRAHVCRQWEAATDPATGAGIRVALMRFGIILGPSGGLLPVLLTPARLGIGTRLGPGTQFMSWVSLEDALRSILWTIADPSLHGPINATAPNPVPNKELADALARAVHRPEIGWAPRWALDLLAGKERAGEVLLSSQRVLPAKLLASGFAFRHSEVEGALSAAVARRSKPPD